MLSLEDVRIEEFTANAVMPYGMRISYALDPTLYVVGNCRTELGKEKMQTTLMTKLAEIVATALKHKPPEKAAAPAVSDDEEKIYMREQLMQMQAKIDKLSVGHAQTKPKRKYTRKAKQAEAA